MLAFKLCSKSYTQFSNLCRHKRTHLEVKSTLNCKYCFTAFQSTASFNKHETICMRERYEASNMNESFGETCIKDSSGTDLSEKEFETDGSFSNKSPARQLPPDSQSGASPFSRHLIELNSLLLKIQQDQHQQQQQQPKQELIPNINTLCYLIQSVLTFMLNKPQQSNAQFNSNPGDRNDLLFDQLADEYYNRQEVSQLPTRDNEMLFYHYLNYAMNVLNVKNS